MVSHGHIAKVDNKSMYISYYSDIWTKKGVYRNNFYDKYVYMCKLTFCITFC